jgi:hypothetical protein
MRTTEEVVTLRGTTEAAAAVFLAGQNTTADGGGAFSVSGVALSLGDNVFTATATDAAGNETSSSETFQRDEPVGGEFSVLIEPDPIVVSPGETGRLLDIVLRSPTAGAELAGFNATILVSPVGTASGSITLIGVQQGPEPALENAAVLASQDIPGVGFFVTASIGAGGSPEPIEEGEQLFQLVFDASGDANGTFQISFLSPDDPIFGATFGTKLFADTSLTTLGVRLGTGEIVVEDPQLIVAGFAAPINGEPIESVDVRWTSVPSLRRRARIRAAEAYADDREVDKFFASVGSEELSDVDIMVSED